MRTADQIATVFVRRLPHGGMLTRKQVTLLLSAYAQPTTRPSGILHENGKQIGTWRVQVWPNGAGQLSLRTAPPQDEYWCAGCERFHVHCEITREETRSSTLLRCRSTGHLLAEQ